MNDNLNPNKESYSPQDIDIEKALRPLSFNDFSGQEQVLENLIVFVQAANLRKEALGKIDMRDMNSWVEIESGAAKQMINAVDGKNYKGRRIRMNDADSGGPKGFSKKEGQ